MNEKTLATAIAEAKRFLKAANAAQDGIKSVYAWVGTKESGACKRASMDLTRALADLRRPG